MTEMTSVPRLIMKSDDDLPFLSETSNVDDTKFVVGASEVDFLTDKTRIMLTSLLLWFNTHDKERMTFLQLLARKERFSLRLIDWMVTNYTKIHKLHILYQGRVIDVHEDYQRQLGIFNKRLFDPFARRQRLTLARPAGVVTTVGQLNFLKWFLERRLDDVLHRLQPRIEYHMKHREGCVCEAVVDIPQLPHDAFTLEFT